MRESFVVHSEYLEDLPEEYKATFLMYTYNYGIHGIIPNLTGLELTIWKKIQRRIDTDQETYETTVQKRSEAGKKHKGNQYTKNNPTVEQMEQMEQCSNQVEQMEQDGTNGTVNVFVNDTDIVNECECVNDNVEQTNTLTNKQSPSLLTGNQTEYAKKIFELFDSAGLPCKNHNFITFLQTDFYQALPLLKKIHSDDVLNAIKNYISVIKNPDCYYHQEYGLPGFLESKKFKDFLPDTFKQNNFLKFDVQKQTAPKDIPKITYKGDVCKACKKQTLFFNNEKQKYICNSCHKEFSYQEIMYAS